MIYDENHNGIQLTSTAVINLVTDPVFQGFFTKSDLQELLNQTDCVGLRVYNAVGSSADLSRRVIGVGVRPNGTEKDARAGVGYILSHAFTAGALPANGTNIGRDNARSLVELAESTFNFATDTRQNIHFSSYFSKTMLLNLLADKNGVAVQGIGLYVVPFTEFHTLVGASFGGAPLQRLASNPAGSHIQSDKPCPGSCAVLAPPPPGEKEEATASSATLETTNTDSSTIYLVNWMRP